MLLKKSSLLGSSDPVDVGPNWSQLYELASLTLLSFTDSNSPASIDADVAEDLEDVHDV